MSEMLLLGAGASVEAKVPGAYDMTQCIYEYFHNSYENKKNARVIAFIIGGLLFEAGKNGQNPLKAGVNVEDLFNAVQLLAERHSLEAAPFVGSWHSMVDEFDKIESFRPNTRSLSQSIYKIVSDQIRKALSDTPGSFESNRIDTALASAITKAVQDATKGRNPSFSPSQSVGKAVESYVKGTAKKWSSSLSSQSPSGSSGLDKEFSDLIDRKSPKPGQGRIFQRTNERMIAALKNLVWIEDNSLVSHLLPILNILKNQKRLVISTLNYDNSIELLATSQNLPFETGIAQWSSTGTFDFSCDGLHLLKLHGSIDWIWDRNVSTSDRPMPHTVIRKIDHAEMIEGESTPAVIFGQRNKLTAEGPFLDLLRAFREELARSASLTVVGYSFRDSHINVYISQWLNSNKNNTIRIINGPRFVKQSSGYVLDLLRLQTASPSQVQIIPEYAGKGLEQLYSEPVTVRESELA